MNFRTSTIQSLSTVTEPTALSSQPSLLLSKIDTYNGSPDPAYQIYKVSESVLLHGHKPTIVDVALLSSAIRSIYADFNNLASKMQIRGNTNAAGTRGGMQDELTGYMLNSEVANDIARMIRQEDVADLTDKFVEDNEASAVASELYSKGEELAQEVMDYAGALGMALITAHGTAMQAAEESEEEEEEG